MGKTAKRPLTPAYVIFYILFWPDTWRILMGLLLTLLFTPHLLPADLSMGGRAMLYVMVAAIGWALSSKPAGWVTGKLKSLILKR
ncbi:MAG: hypothetical protein ABFS43_17390 [Thermodesulfobacteriota bacterium]